MKYKILLMERNDRGLTIVTDIHRAQFAFIESCGETIEDFSLRIKKTLELVGCDSTIDFFHMEYAFYDQVIYCVKIIGNQKRKQVIPLRKSIVSSFNLEKLVEPSGNGYVFRKDIDDAIFIVR